MAQEENSQQSADFVMVFAELARRLAAIGVTVSVLDLAYDTFGSWTLIARKGDEAVRFCFDGKESYLVTQISPIQRYSFPNQWKQVEDQPTIRQYKEAVSYAESFLRERFGENSN